MGNIKIDLPAAVASESHLSKRKLGLIEEATKRSDQAVVLLGGWGFHNSLDARY